MSKNTISNKATFGEKFKIISLLLGTLFFGIFTAGIAVAIGVIYLSKFLITNDSITDHDMIITYYAVTLALISYFLCRKLGSQL